MPIRQSLHMLKSDAASAKHSQSNLRKDSKNTTPLTVILAGTLLSGIATNSQANPTAVGVNLGTNGLGIELSHALTPSLVSRFSLSGYKVDIDLEEDGIDYTVELNSSNFAAIIDWHPWQGGLHFSTGLINNGTRFEMTSEQSDSYEVGNNTYIGTLNLQAAVKFRRVSPYVGLGWNNAVMGDSGLGWSAQLGVILQGEPTVTLAADGSNITQSGSTTQIDVTTNEEFQDDLKAEQALVQEELDDWKLYPVISFGLHYQF